MPGQEPPIDEFGIPIKTKKVPTQPTVDEFGIPVKKKETANWWEKDYLVGGGGSLLGGMAGNGLSQSNGRVSENGKLAQGVNVGGAFDIEGDDPIGNALKSEQRNAAKYIYPDVTTGKPTGISPLQSFQALNKLKESEGSLMNTFAGNADVAHDYITKELAKKGIAANNLNAINQYHNPKNLTQKLAVQSLNKIHNIKTAISDAGSIEDAAIEYFKRTDDEKGRQAKFYDNMAAVPDEVMGEWVDKFTSDPDVFALAKHDKTLQFQIDAARNNMYQNFPKYAENVVKRKIGQERENKGMNSLLANNPSVEKTEEVASEMLSKGKLSKNEYDVWEKRIKPVLGALHEVGAGSEVIPTPDIQSSLGEGLEQGFGGILSTIKQIGAISDTERKNKITSENIRKEYASLGIQSSSEIGKVLNTSAHLTGFLVPMVLGGIAKVPSMATNAIMFGGSNMDRAQTMFPGDQVKQDAYTVLTTGADVFLGSKLPFGKVQSEIKTLINRFSSGQITGTEAKGLFIKLIEGNVKTGGIITGFGAVHNAADAVFGGKDLSAFDIAKQAIEDAPINFFAATPLSLMHSIGRNKTTNGETIKAAVESPDIEKKIIEGGNQESIQNFQTAKNAWAEIKDLDIAEKDKGNFLLKDLQQKVFEEKAKNSTVSINKEKWEKKAKEAEIEKNMIYDPDRGVQKDVQEFYDNDLLPQGIKESLEVDGKFSPSKVGGVLKELAQQANNLDSEWRPHTGEFKMTKPDVPDALIEMANERWKDKIPQPKEIESYQEPLKTEKEQAGGASGVEGGDVESKKADIERRRQEELNQQTDAGYSTIALDYLFTGGRDVIQSTDYLLQALVGGFTHSAKEINDIRNKYTDKLGNIKDDVNSDIYNQMMSEIKDVINKNYNSSKATEIFDKILKNATGFISREGNQVSAELDKLNEENESKINAKYDTELAALEKQQPPEQSTKVEGGDVVKQIENFGVPKEDVDATHGLLNQVFSGLKKAGLTAAKTVGDWVGIGKGSEKPYSLKIGDKEVQVKNTQPEVVNGFYSPLEKIINEAKSDKLPAKQWAEKYANSEEAKWTGLKDWLAQQQGSVSKSDIQKYLKENRIQVVEVAKGYEVSDKIKEQIKDAVYSSEWVDFGNGIRAKGDVGGFSVIEVNGRKERLSTIEAENKLNSLLTTDNNNPKFHPYQLSGDKENYKEVLVTMPSRVSGFKKKTYERAMDLVRAIRYKELPDAQLKEIIRNEYGITEDIVKRVRESDNSPAELNDALNTIKAAEKEQLTELSSKDFKSSHFDEPNILVHLRMNTRTDANGNKVLFLEEVQSDWGQKGKKEGFRTDEKPLDKSELSAKKVDERDRTTYWDIYKGNLIVARSVNGGESQNPQDVVDMFWKVEKTTRLKPSTAGQPSAPFVTDTNAWTKLGLKVALKEAVKQGADKIAWTTGTQQFDRWGSEKISWKKEVSEKYPDRVRWKIDLKEQESGNAFDGINIDEKALSESNVSVSTKEQLREVLNRNLKRERNDAEIDKLTGRIWDRMQKEDSGTSLPRKEGMESFYGKPDEGKLGIVGNVAKSLFKQEPGTIELQTTSTGIASQDKVLRLRDWVQKNKNDDYSYNDAQKDIESNSKLYQEYQKNIPTQHSIDITPEMKAEVEGKGQPLFKDAEAQYRIESGKNIIEAIKDFNQSKNKARATVALTHEIMHPTVVSIIDGAKEGNEVGKKHTETIVNEFNKANPNSKVTVEDLIKGNDAFKDGTTSKQYRAVQEFIAKAWEKYHTEGGKGFSEAFQKVLDQITKAFQSVYKSITGKQLTPELKQMFDDILGKEAPTQYTEAATPAKKQSEGVSGSALKDVGRTAKAVSKRVAVEHAGYEGAKRVTGANENTLELDGYGTVSTSQFINTLVENGRLPKDALKNRHIQLTDEYATKLLNENSDLFPKENTETNKTEANLPTFESAKKEYDNVKEKHNKYLKKDGGLRANTPDNVKKEIEDAYTKMQSMVKQERDKRVSEDKRDTGLIDGIERIKDNTSAFTLVRMAMNRGVIPERQFNEFGKNLLHIIADAKDSHEVTMQTAEIIQDFSQRANVKVDDLLAREIQAAENLKYEPVEEVKAPTQYTEAATPAKKESGGVSGSALKDVESTAKALEGVDKIEINKKQAILNAEKIDKGSGSHVKKMSLGELNELARDMISNEKYYQDKLQDAQGVYNLAVERIQELSESYHKAKSDGSNPELVEAVEDLLGKAPTQYTEAATPKEQAQKIADLTEKRDRDIAVASKPDVKLEFVSAKELVDSKDPIGNRNIHNDIKERFKKLKEILDCIHG